MGLSHEEQLGMFTALACMLGLARGMGELAKRLGQPSVLGEILAGILLGKTVLRQIWPEGWHFMFDPKSPNGYAISGIATLAVTLFMLVAGIEMQLSSVVRRGWAALTVALSSIVAPLILGFVLAYVAPDSLGATPTAKRSEFALLCGTAMSITALPVVAKTLRDLHLFRTEMGITVMAAATMCDLIGWGLFAVVLAVSGASEGGPGLGPGLALSVIFIVVMLSLGRMLIHRVLPWVQAYLSWPGGVLGFVGAVALISASFATYIGLHSTLGAFIAGAAMGDSSHLRPKLRDTLDHFVSFIFVPLFFSSIGLYVDFIADFDIALIAIVLSVSCVGKMVGAYIGARLSKSRPRQSLAIAVCMNSRGAMEIILANVALDHDLIDGRMFVALVLMAIITSLMPGPLLARILGRAARPAFISFCTPRAFVRQLQATTAEEAVFELCSAAGCPLFAPAIWAAEQREPTGNGDCIAVPHAPCSGLASPILAIGFKQEGLDFRSPSNDLSQIVVVVLAPDTDPDIEQDLVTEITANFGNPDFRKDVLAVNTYTELVAMVQIAKASH